MGDKKGIVDLFFLAAEQMVDRKDVSVSGLLQIPETGFFGGLKDIKSHFSLMRQNQYYEAVTFSRKTGEYRYSFSNLLSNPRPGQEKEVEFVTRDPGLVARRLTQYKVA